MRIKKNFELRNICGENIVITHGVDNIDFTAIITLNDSAAYLWNQVKDRDFTKEDAVRILLDAYNVAEDRAREDVEELLALWEEMGLLEYRNLRIDSWKIEN